MKRVFASLVLLVLATSAAGCRDRGEDGTREDEIRSAGRTRTFLYRLPPGHTTDRRWPLLVALHGRLGQGDSAEKMGRMSALADREGIVVAYPDGFRRSWHDLREVGPAARNDVDDVAFIRDLVDHMIASHGVDPERVYVAGMSNGGFMSIRVACELSDRVAAVGVVTATMPDVPRERCSPSRAVPIVFINGTDDPLVDDAGDDEDWRGSPALLSSEDSRKRWATMNRCAEDELPAVETIDRVDDGTSVVKTAHTRCPGASDVVLYSVRGGGHTWPNGDQYLPEAVIGKVSRDIDATEELWSFFRQRTQRSGGR